MVYLVVVLVRVKMVGEVVPPAVLFVIVVQGRNHARVSQPVGKPGTKIDPGEVGCAIIGHDGDFGGPFLFLLNHSDLKLYIGLLLLVEIDESTHVVVNAPWGPQRSYGHRLRLRS